MIVFAGVPGAQVCQELKTPALDCDRGVFTVQQKAYCDESIMLEWIEEVWAPGTHSCRLLLLDSLQVHKMASVRKELEDVYHTQVVYVPPGMTCLSQPMDLSAMKTFKDRVRYDVLMLFTVIWVLLTSCCVFLATTTSSTTPSTAFAPTQRSGAD